MKNSRMQSAGKVFLAAVTFILSAGCAAAFAQNGNQNPLLSDAIQHCGCDRKEGVEMYVQNVINDAQKRGLTCETTKIHAFACIASYCSICREHPKLMENCMKMGAEYLAASPGFCQIDGNLTAGRFMPLW